MRKLICGICCIILLLILSSFSLADSVTQMNYELIVDGESRIGKYTGNIENGLPSGYGVFETSNPYGYSWHYVGYWQDGLMQGEGATYWEDGSLEIGSYEHGFFVFGYCNYDGADLMLYMADDLDRSLDEEIVIDSDSYDSSSSEVLYIGNRNSKVFHRPDCSSVSTMKEKNKVEFYSRDEAIGMDYKPCGGCMP